MRNSHTNSNGKWERRAAVYAWILYLLSLVPLLIAGLYNYPSADDFSMGAPAHLAYLEGGPLAAMKAAVYMGWYDYQNWMGYFTSTVLMSLPPNVFGEKYYALSTVILVGIFTLAAAYLMHVIFVRIFGCGKAPAAAVTAILLFLSVQCMPQGMARVESFYWYCSGANYFLTLSLGMIWLGMLLTETIRGMWPEISTFDPENKFEAENGATFGESNESADPQYEQQKDGCVTNKRRTNSSIGVRYILLLLLSFWIGGGNYMTALSCAIIGVLLMAAAGLCRIEKLRRFMPGERPVYLPRRILAPCLLMLAGFVCSCLAPGNNVRGSSVEGFGAVKTVMISLYYVLRYCLGEWNRWEVVMLMLLMLPFLVLMARQSRFSFSYPLIFTAFMYGLAAANICPPLFALGNLEAGRLQALFWVQYLLLLTLMEFYWVGWIVKRVPEWNAGGLLAREEQDGGRMPLQERYCLMLLAIFLFGSAMCIKVDPDYYTFTSAEQDLLSGEAALYRAENAARRDVLTDPAVTDAELRPFSVRPDVLFYSDITEDPEDWQNRGVARYYQKQSVVLTTAE